MNYETDKFIREYFEKRPQLDPPAYSSIVGYAVPASSLHMIESLLNERHELRHKNRGLTAESRRMKSALEKTGILMRETGTLSGQTISTGWVLGMVEAALPSTVEDKQ